MVWLIWLTAAPPVSQAYDSMSPLFFFPRYIQVSPRAAHTQWVGHRVTPCLQSSYPHCPLLASQLPGEWCRPCMFIWRSSRYAPFLQDDESSWPPDHPSWQHHDEFHSSQWLHGCVCCLQPLPCWDSPHRPTTVWGLPERSNGSAPGHPTVRRWPSASVYPEGLAVGPLNVSHPGLDLRLLCVECWRSCDLKGVGVEWGGVGWGFKAVLSVDFGTVRLEASAAWLVQTGKGIKDLFLFLSPPTHS